MGSKSALRKIWHFIWEDDSFWSWIVNVILAFVLIKYVVYPVLGVTLATTHPVVAVVSESMEHDSNFNKWWNNAGTWYVPNGIQKEDFEKFPLKNGFNKGDIMVLRGLKPEKVEVGDVIVFWGTKRDPIIHRVVKTWQESGKFHYQTKGDNYKTNPTSIRNPTLDETNISEEQVIGHAVVRIPLLGYIKIGFVELVDNFRTVLFQKG